jgi:hypothetical protein
MPKPSRRSPAAASGWSAARTSRPVRSIVRRRRGGQGSLRDKNGRRYGVEACDGHRVPLKNVRLIRRADSQPALASALITASGYLKRLCRGRAVGVVDRGHADIGRYVPGVQVSLRLYSDQRRNSVIAFATRSGASNVRR